MFRQQGSEPQGENSQDLPHQQNQQQSASSSSSSQATFTGPFGSGTSAHASFNFPFRMPFPHTSVQASPQPQAAPFPHFHNIHYSASNAAPFAQPNRGAGDTPQPPFPPGPFGATPSFHVREGQARGASPSGRRAGPFAPFPRPAFAYPSMPIPPFVNISSGSGVHPHATPPPGFQPPRFPPHAFPGPAFHVGARGGGTVQVDPEGWEVPSAEWLREQHEPVYGPPPASRQFLSRLPDVVVKEQDLLDENNAECCICMEAQVVGEKAARLPCQHLFHRPCIVDWLQRHCSCPVCRFELETDNRQFEGERKRRMSSRRLRLRAGELERKSAIEIKRILESINLPLRGCLEKADMIAQLFSSDLVDIVPDIAQESPSPPSCRRSESESSVAKSQQHSNSDTTASPCRRTNTASVSEAFQPLASAARHAGVSQSRDTLPPTSNAAEAGQSHYALSIEALRAMGIGPLRRFMQQYRISAEGCLEKEDMLQRVLMSGLVDVRHQHEHMHSNDDASQTSSVRAQSDQGQADASRTNSQSNSGQDDEWVIVSQQRTSGEEAQAAEPVAAVATANEDYEVPERSASCARTELLHLSVAELRVLMARLDISTTGCVDKEGLIERLVASGRSEEASVVR